MHTRTLQTTQFLAAQEDKPFSDKGRPSWQRTVKIITSSSSISEDEFPGNPTCRSRQLHCQFGYIPSGYLTVCHGKWPIYRCFTYSKGWFSMAMLNNQMVNRNSLRTYSASVSPWFLYDKSAMFVAKNKLLVGYDTLAMEQVMHRLGYTINQTIPSTLLEISYETHWILLLVFPFISAFLSIFPSWMPILDGTQTWWIPQDCRPFQI